MSKINCVIVDDEASSRKVIQHFVSKIEILQLLESFCNPFDAKQFIENTNDIDLIFLDINMPQQSGIDFYKSVNTDIAVIFTTAHPEYAVEGFNLNAVDYLLKPIAYERFVAAINKVILQQPNKEQENHLIIKENKTLHKVELYNVIYLEAMSDYVKVVLKHKTIMTHSTFNKFIEKLPQNFVRVHKSYCVNTNYLEQISGNQVIIEHLKIPIGKTYKEKLLEKLQNNI